MSSISVGAHQTSWIIGFIRSSIGAKVIMAVTGLAMFGFLIGHIAGNLLIFSGREAINAYAEFLKSKPALIWGARMGLIAMVTAHILSGLRLAALNRAARPEGYRQKRAQRSTVFSKTMTWSGVVVIAFIAFHLAHFTLGLTHPEHYHLTDPQGRHDVYSMFILGFQQPLVAVFYVLSMVLLGFHLAHGSKSMFQTLGLNHPKYNALFTLVAPGIALLVVAGNIAMPLAVLARFVTLPEGVM